MILHRRGKCVTCNNTTVESKEFIENKAFNSDVDTTINDNIRNEQIKIWRQSDLFCEEHR